jgi:hypothetical protein
LASKILPQFYWYKKILKKQKLIKKAVESHGSIIYTLRNIATLVDRINMNKPVLEEVSWQNVRKQVAEKNGVLSHIIDELSPGKEYSLYKAKYPFGSEILKNGELQLPFDGELFPITDARFAKVREKLGEYNLNSNPVTLVLANSAEVFMILDDNTIPLYGLISPGKVFGTWRLLSTSRTHNPIFIWNMTAGARSLFMLPKISEKLKHAKLRREFNLGLETPKNLLDDWEIFRALANSEKFGDSWTVEMLFFPKIWFEKLNDPAWRDFKNYLLQTAFDGSEFWRNEFIWDIALSLMQKRRNIRPNPYIADTVKHLLAMGIGALPGFSAALDNTAGPIKRLQEIYVDVYQVPYAPIIMQPNLFNVESDRAVYYSLSYPTTIKFSPRSREESSKLSDLYDIKSLLQKYLSDISNVEFNLADTPIFDLPSKVKYDFFHTDIENYSGIRPSSDIPLEDASFSQIPYGGDKEFPVNSPFVKGCLRLTRKS